MSDADRPLETPPPKTDAAELAKFAEADTGGRHPTSVAVARLITGTAIVWSLFQLWIASPLPFLLGRIIPVLNDTETRSIHLAFALFLAYLVFPILRSGPRERVPVYDWIFAAAGAFSAGYIFLMYEELSQRPGLATDLDLAVAVVGLALLLEATRRALGPALTVVALLSLAYVFVGHGRWVPEVLQWHGASMGRAMSHMWLTTEGVFGVAIGVSTSFIFLYVLFGALLDRAGAGNYFIMIAFALLGRMRGGPAKAAVVASGLNGLVSGSSIANVVTGGSLTIPLMMRVGYTPAKAAAIEVASSVNGQIMPPVMGAAAFLMVEYVGISYSEVIRHAFLPAVITYIALLYIVHLEALKLGMRGLPGIVRPWRERLLRSGIGISSSFIVLGIVYYAIIGTQALFGDASFWIVMAGFVVAYAGLLFIASRQPDLPIDDPSAEIAAPPPFIEVFLTGLHFILPVYILVWCLMVAFLSPGLAAYWATLSLIFIILTQRPIIAFFRGAQDISAAVRLGFGEFVGGLIDGARNMIGIALATAAAGIIVGMVTLTGIGQVMTAFVEVLSGGNLLLMLIFVAIISLILGMGLPTTANYIVVATLMAPVVVAVGAQQGFVVPLIAVHLFVFYFGLMADVTPPVGLASFAGAAIAREDPIKTGVQAFIYESRTIVLPFMFIFNTKLLLIGIEGPIDLVLTLATGIGAGLLVAAAMQGWFWTRSRLWESAALLLVAFTLFRPGFWMDRAVPPVATKPPATILQDASSAPAGSDLRIVLNGPDFTSGQPREMVLIVPLGAPGGAAERLARAGLLPVVEGDTVRLDEPMPTTPLFRHLRDFDFYADQPVRVVALETAVAQPPKEVFWIPALLLLGVVFWVQRRRVRRGAGAGIEKTPSG